MEDLLRRIGLGVVLFATTNIDDLFVLLGFFADSKFRVGQVVAGQFLGIGALYGACVAASLLSLVVAPAYIGLLGLFPIAIGLKRLRDRHKGQEESEDRVEVSTGHGNVIAVAAVTIANGGDNLGIYTPIFATRTGYDVGVIGVVFAVMTLAWLLAAHWLTHHRTLGLPIRRYGKRVVPFVLIALGVMILHEAGTLGLLRR